MKYAKINKCDAANGDGVRVSLFVSGCRHYCKGCFNAEAWDFDYGNDFTRETVDGIITALSPSYITGLTILGGEPMDPKNRGQLIPLLEQVRTAYPHKDIWCYTGYTLDELLKEDDPDVIRVLQVIDILVDGRFVEELKSPNLRFKGSANQRIILVQKTLETGAVALWEGEKYQEMSNAGKNNQA